MRIIVHAGTGTYFDVEDGVYVVDVDDIPDFDPDVFDEDPSYFAVKYGSDAAPLVDAVEVDDRLLDAYVNLSHKWSLINAMHRTMH